MTQQAFVETMEQFAPGLGKMKYDVRPLAVDFLHTVGEVSPCISVCPLLSLASWISVYVCVPYVFLSICVCPVCLSVCVWLDVITSPSVN